MIGIKVSIWRIDLFRKKQRQIVYVSAQNIFIGYFLVNQHYKIVLHSVGTKHKARKNTRCEASV